MSPHQSFTTGTRNKHRAEFHAIRRRLRLKDRARSMVTLRRSRSLASGCQRGVAVLLVLAVLAITVGLAYGLSYSSSTMYRVSENEHTSLRTRAAANFAPSPAFERLASDPNWLPCPNPITGALSSGESFATSVQTTRDGGGRGIASTAQCFDPEYKNIQAEQYLSIELAKQRRDNYPTAAIAALAHSNYEPSVYIAKGNTVRGNIRSRGPIHFQKGFDFSDRAYVLQNIAQDGTDSKNYLTYQTSWGSNYQATELCQYGIQTSDGTRFLAGVTLGPSPSNPMGVYYHSGDLLLGPGVVVVGTLVVRGNLIIFGTEVKLFALREAVNPDTSTLVKTSFPAVVCDKTVVFDPAADAVRISGLVLAGAGVIRLSGKDDSWDRPGWGTLGLTGNWSSKYKSVECTHDHKISIDAIPDPFETVNGPAIYIKGAILADRVLLEDEPKRPFALVFDAARTDTTDAPGFFTWRSNSWVEASQ